MKTAKQEANDLIKAASTVKIFTGVGSITIGKLSDFKSTIDNYEEFIKIIDNAGYCLQPRNQTALGLFPDDNNEEYVFIEK